MTANQGTVSVPKFDTTSGRVGVVDIGSNSVRLVVFDGLKRVPVPLFNEKILCGLGRGLDGSGQLNPDGVQLALNTLRRFVGLAQAMNLQRLDLLATAAVRDASNGPTFVQEVESLCSLPVRVLTGAEESRLSAEGVLSGQPNAQGFMGDLGGGSLEVVALGEGAGEAWATLPLGPLRLMDAAGDDREKIQVLIDQQLSGQAWLSELEERDFYAVGGAWRALARIHMEQTHYPLHMIHGYSMDQEEALELTGLVSHLGKRSLASMTGVNKRRIETLPSAAMLMRRIIELARPKRIVFSAYGLREGWVHNQLDSEVRASDPLLSAAADWGAREARFGDLGEQIAAWCLPLFPDRDEEAERLCRGACHLSDVGWRYHPDYRAEHVLLRVLRAQELCIEHFERAFIGRALYSRYGGNKNAGILNYTRQLLSEERVRMADALGRALRLAYTLSGGDPQMLEVTTLNREEDCLVLQIPADAAVPPGQMIEKRLSSLASALKIPRSDIQQV
ncbi:Ppx/GppA family phosphatase [Fodinicurvata fenggangensis]|uniref:Ppx/GppA family phosphatase n=1 Tax=Fodinicurvata fenggangensis TaxID=1121830 RepID=UPI0004799D53|nr:Ppx/GppA family phosphatase [Fodinicurvata fenggangensis]